MPFPQLFRSPTTRLIVGAFTISFSGVWVQLAGVSPTASAFYRVLFGALFLLVCAVSSRERIIPGRAALLLGILCGILFALDLVCWHHSIRLIGPGLATILGNFQVFILAGVGVVLLRERYSMLFLAAIPLAVAGLFLIVGFDWSNMPHAYRSGILFGLATAIFYAGYIICLKRLSARSSGLFLPMLLVSACTALLLGISMLAAAESFALPDWRSLVHLVSLGFFSQCFGWLLIATSLPRTQTSTAGLILLLQPALSFLWDVLFFARPTDLGNWFGVAITLLAIYLGLSTRRGQV